MTGQAKPRVYLIGTGGSISFVGRERTDFINYSYDNKHFSIQELLDRVPEVGDFAVGVAGAVPELGQHRHTAGPLVGAGRANQQDLPR